MNTRVKVTAHIITIGVGTFVALLISLVLALFSHIAAVITFLVLVAVWAAINVSGERHQVEARGGRLGLFPDPQRWSSSALPLEFRFITHYTPIEQVLTKIGTPSKRPPIPRGAVRYDWPDGRIIFVYAQGSDRTVSAIQIFASLSDIPINEFI